MYFSYDYDSHFAFLEAIKSLESFNRLIAERNKAHYGRREDLRSWVILGRYHLDSCGNTMKYVGKDIPAVIFPNLPPVMMQKEFQDYVKKNSPDKEIWCSASIGSDIPPANLICPECKAGWTIQNCHDTVVAHKLETIPMHSFVGKKISEVKKHWSLNRTSLWVLQPDASIRNDLYIDLSIVDSEWGRKYQQKVNGRGWIAVEDDYVVLNGDEALVNIWTYRHFLCHRQYQARIEKQYFLDIFTEAGFKDITLAETKNEYCSCEHCAPWYVVYADKLYFLIGWRKRVINIESDDPRINFAELFAEEKTTKGQQAIHARGKEKCVEYLRKIREVV